MLILYSILAALLWGSLIGGSLHRGDPLGKVHLARGHLIIGAVLFTIPVVATLIKSPVTYPDSSPPSAPLLLGLS